MYKMGWNRGVLPMYRQGYTYYMAWAAWFLTSVSIVLCLALHVVDHRLSGQLYRAPISLRSLAMRPMDKTISGSQKPFIITTK